MNDYQYEEGAWFAVPLHVGGFAVGVVARFNGTGIALGYFFGPRRASTPSLSELELLQPDEALFVRRFGDLHLIEGKWRILGRHKGWLREEWPVPMFYREDPLMDNVKWRVEYSDSDILKPVLQTQIALDDCTGLPFDGILGAGALERLLDHQLPP